MSRGRGTGCRSAGGPSIVKSNESRVMVTWDLPLWTEWLRDRHDWKRCLLATLLAGGKDQNLSVISNLMLNDIRVTFLLCETVENPENWISARLGERCDSVDNVQSWYSTVLTDQVVSIMSHTQFLKSTNIVKTVCNVALIKDVFIFYLMWSSAMSSCCFLQSSMTLFMVVSESHNWFALTLFHLLITDCKHVLHFLDSRYKLQSKEW